MTPNQLLHSRHLHAGLVMTQSQWMMILVLSLQVELVILGLGLAFGALQVEPFSEKYFNVTAHIINSIYPFLEYDQLSYNINNLLYDYRNVHLMTLAYYKSINNQTIFKDFEN
jgi:hypothetical protein